MNTPLRSVLVLAAFTAVSVLRADPIVANGSFEFPPVGSGNLASYSPGNTIGGTAWVVASGTYNTVLIDKDFAGGGVSWPHPVDGNQFLYLANSISDATIYQHIQLQAGHSYDLSFWIADFSSHDFGAGGRVRMGLQDPDSVYIFPILTADVGQNTGFYQFTQSFTAASTGTYTLGFASVNGYAGILDDVRITDTTRTNNVPDSTTTAGLLLISLGLIAGVRRCRR